MTIEIHKPELEALIRDWMKTGAFPTVEDALIQALKSSPLPSEASAGSAGGASSSTGAVVLAALQASPYPEIDLTPPRHPCPLVPVPSAPEYSAFSSFKNVPPLTSHANPNAISAVDSKQNVGLRFPIRFSTLKIIFRTMIKSMEARIAYPQPV